MVSISAQAATSQRATKVNRVVDGLGGLVQTRKLGGGRAGQDGREAVLSGATNLALALRRFKPFAASVTTVALPFPPFTCSLAHSGQAHASLG